MFLSVLDQSSIRDGEAAAAALRETVALAPWVERHGYRRYWLAEHHNSAAHAGSAPEILAGALLAATTHIRVGSAGVMLPHYAALKVAEQFRVLEALHPGRVDLGVGRAPGSDGMTAYALNPLAAQQGADHFPGQVFDLLHYLGDGLPEGHPLLGVRAGPEVPTRPEVWMLGSSDFGARAAAHFGLPYCFADFITERGGEAVIALYRRLFRPSPWCATPRAAVAVFALAAATEAEAAHHAQSRALMRIRRDRGQFLPMPPPDALAHEQLSPAEEASLARWREGALVGAAEAVAARLAALARLHQADEVAILAPCFDAEARRRSFALIAEAAAALPAAA
ncbi:MAG: LLM class flavin-dependent oxidoreductase [Acetobacteraceae bacterium]|nr:LLM class flavin-dependent oxidoreductase [Acetobacteraceae bacterium]